MYVVQPPRGITRVESRPAGLQEAVRRDLNLTETAKALFTSQPGVSKQLRMLHEAGCTPIVVVTVHWILGRCQLTAPRRVATKHIL